MGDKKMGRTNFKDIFSKMKPQCRATAEKLLTELNFMEKTLRGLRKDIETEGATDKSGKISAALRAYNMTARNYSVLLKQFEKLLRDEKIGEDGETALQNWLNAQK